MDVCIRPLPSTEIVTSFPIVFGGCELSTVTVTGVDLLVVLVISVADTVITCCPADAVCVSQKSRYGADVRFKPTCTPST